MSKSVPHDLNEPVELGRFFAALAIIWLHTVGGSGVWEESTRLTRWAVPYFVAASLWFGAIKIRKESPCNFFLERFLRLYPVFLIWNFVYLFARLFAGLLFNSEIKFQWNSFLPDFFVDGYAHHLWFLNFLILAQAIQALLQATKCSSGISALLGAIGILLYWIVVELKYHRVFSLNYLLELTWWSLPALFSFPIFKYFHAQLAFRGLSFAVVGRFYLVCGIVILFFSCGGTRSALLEGLTGVLFFFACLAIGEGRKNFFPGLLIKVFQLAAGIYLIHVLFIEGLQDIFEKFLPMGPKMENVIVFLLATPASIAGALVVKKMFPDWVLNGCRLKRQL